MSEDPHDGSKIRIKFIFRLAVVRIIFVNISGKVGCLRRARFCKRKLRQLTAKSELTTLTHGSYTLSPSGDI
jgi:hypothetical protein